MRERNHPEVEQEDSADAKRDERHWAEQAEQRAVGLLAMEVLPLLYKHEGNLSWSACGHWRVLLFNNGIDIVGKALGPHNDASAQTALETIRQAVKNIKPTFSEIVNELLEARKAS